MSEDYVNEILSYFEATKVCEETHSCDICGIIYHTRTGIIAHRKKSHYQAEENSHAKDPSLSEETVKQQTAHSKDRAVTSRSDKGIVYNNKLLEI